VKQLKIPYGSQSVELEIPPIHWGELLAPGTEAHPRAADLEAALQQPLDSPGLDEFLEGCRSLLILVNDETRRAGSGSALVPDFRAEFQNPGGYRYPPAEPGGKPGKNFPPALAGTPRESLFS
jgi:hypothetical protein